MRRLGQLSSNDLQHVGGKARNLDALIRAGLPVPKGIVFLNNETPDAKVVSDFIQELQRDGFSSVAVRSSASLEDGNFHSFAGIFETYLNISGATDGLRAIENCVASLRDARAREYCEKNGIPFSNLKMSVIIQAMIDGEVSGVAFTVNPINGRDCEIVIEAVSGNGEKLVQGTKTPDRYSYDWFNDRFSFQPSGLEPLLSQGEIKKLSELLLKIQRNFGCPQDIEWTYSADNFLILQSRPLTKIINQVDTDWTNANMKDGGVASSVANPFIISLYKMMMNQTMPTYFKGLKMMDETESLDWVGVFGSNIYWNLSAVKNCVRQLPGFIEREFDLGLGIEPNYSGKGRQTSLNFKSLIKGLQVIGPLKKSLKKRPALSQGVLDYAEKVFSEYADMNFSALSDSELSRKAFQLVDAHWFNIEGGYFYHIYDNGNLRTLFMKKLERNQKKVRLNYLQLVLGLDSIPHLDPMNELYDIAQKIALNSSLYGGKESITATELSDLYHSTREFPLRLELASYLYRYRFHSYRELDLLVPCWEEDPSQVFEALASMLKSGARKTVRSQYAVQRAIYLEQRTKIKSPKLLEQLDQHRNFLKMRENLRIESARGFYLIRKTFLAVGQRLKERGLILEKEDVFFLSYEVACDALSNANTPVLSGLVFKQRLYYESFRHYEKPNEIWKKSAEMKMGRSSGQKELKGVGCSPGVVEGTVKLIESIQDMHSVGADAILVTRYIDPAWPVFLSDVKGIITEAGGILSHGAIISREYGIPAVLSTPRATELLKSGTRVRMDGESGSIIILEQDAGVNFGKQ
jgi:phosphohistidine swiveling domain-containing protein